MVKAGSLRAPSRNFGSASLSLSKFGAWMHDLHVQAARAAPDLDGRLLDHEDAGVGEAAQPCG